MSRLSGRDVPGRACEAAHFKFTLASLRSADRVRLPPLLAPFTKQRPEHARLKGLSDNPAYQWWRDPNLIQPHSWWARARDAAILEGNPRRMLVLGENAVTVHEFRDGHWIPGSPLAINHDRPLPRDARGRIVLRNDHLFDAYLPGLICRSTNASPLTLNCSRSDDPWPLQTEDFGVSGFFAPARNFFTGALVPGVGQQKSAPAFYSAAALPRGKYALWIFAGVDGQLHLLDGMNHQIEGSIHWGSDIAAVHAPCRQDWQVLATSAGSGKDDSVQAFEFADREPVAVSQALQLNGDLTALWTARNGDSATAVVRDSETGNYEAVQLTLTCGQ